jgi:hypothetical protein
VIRGPSAQQMHCQRLMGWQTATRWGVMLMLVSSLSSACLLPPEAEITLADLNYPPEYDLRSISPVGSRLDVNPLDCTSFPVEVGAIWDKDDATLLLRWVANNNRPNTQEIEPPDRSVAEPGEARSAFTRVAANQHFVDEFTLAASPERPTTVGILSLFITDAPQWQVEDANNAERRTLDLSRVTDDLGVDAGVSPYGVVEVRWSVVFSDRLEGCPQ